ncbi:hypothetical protein [Bacillus cihuensis]|nr:hypothetical protein [Bacillus cihuensis]
MHHWRNKTFDHFIKQRMIDTEIAYYWKFLNKDKKIDEIDEKVKGDPG